MRRRLVLYTEKQIVCLNYVSYIIQLVRNGLILPSQISVTVSLR